MRGFVERFLFSGLDPRGAAILRIWIALGVARAFYPSDRAVLSAMLRTPWTVELYGDILFTLAYWAVAMIPVAAFGAGLWSRWSGLAASLLLAPLVPQMHGIVSHYLLWFALTSLALLHADRKWALRDAIGRPQTAPAGPVWPVRLIQLQLSTLYLTNAIAKSHMGYLSGGALAAMSQQLPNFQMDLTSGEFALAGIAMPLWLAATASALAEYSLAFGFWFPALRWYTAALGVAFHGVLTQVVEIGGLDITSVGLYAVFLVPLTAARRPSGESA